MFRLFAILLVSLVVSGLAKNSAIGVTENFISNRQKGMQLAEEKMLEIKKALKKSDFESIMKDARVMELWSKKMLSYFPKGSEASIDNHSSASSDIWNRFHYFEKLVNDKQAGIGQIILSTQSKNKAQVKDAVRQTTNTCNNCHEQFRN